jgi:hypothetical protein
MPLLAPERFPKTNDVRPLWESSEILSQGFEGRYVHEQLRLVGRHWIEKPSTSNEKSDDALIEQLTKSLHREFENVGTVKVRLGKLADLQPRQFDLDEYTDD